MTIADTQPQVQSAPQSAKDIGDAWSRMVARRRLYTGIGLLILIIAFVSSVRFADESNAGHFFDRLPHLFDFLSWLIPKDWADVYRALFDLPSPNGANGVGGEEFNFPNGRVYVWGDFYIPEYFELMIITINVALVSTIVGFVVALPLSFFAARNMSPSHPLRLVTKRFMELLRAFPEIVIAGLFSAILSIGPIAAIIAVGLHTIGALGKLFSEVLCATAPGNQCPRLDHHRRRRRRRHRRGAETFDLARLRRQDGGPRAVALRDDHCRRPIFRMAPSPSRRRTCLPSATLR
jgi:phosphonate transport system permease protein